MTGISPTNAYPCLPSPATPSIPTYIIIGANGDTLYARLMRAIDREDLVGSDYAQNHHRVVSQAEIEEAFSGWKMVRPAKEVLIVLDKAGIPIGRVVGVKEIVENEQVKARGGRNSGVGGERKQHLLSLFRSWPLSASGASHSCQRSASRNVHTDRLGQYHINLVLARSTRHRDLTLPEVSRLAVATPDLSENSCIPSTRMTWRDKT